MIAIVGTMGTGPGSGGELASGRHAANPMGVTLGSSCSRLISQSTFWFMVQPSVLLAEDNDGRCFSGRLAVNRGPERHPRKKHVSLRFIHPCDAGDWTTYCRNDRESTLVF